MRLGALVAIWMGLGGGALAAAPEDAYWRARLEAIARLRALVAEKADPDVIDKVERAALDALGRKILEIVGPVEVEGASLSARSHVGALKESPAFGQLDGFLLEGPGGQVVVTTDALLRRWLADVSPLRANPDAGQPEKPRPSWANSIKRALQSDEMYGVALGEDRFVSVLDIKLPKPEGAALVSAKLGRWSVQPSAAPYPVLIVTVAKGRRVFIAWDSLKVKAPEVPACSTLAASREKAQPDASGWGPGVNEEAFETWRNCERKGLPQEAGFAKVKREAREIAERLARAK